MNEAKFEDLLGQTLAQITGVEKGSEEVRFITQDGKQYVMNHCQDCCESVRVEDVCGHLDDIIGWPLLQAEEATSNDKFQTQDEYGQSDSWTWTFYRLTTQRGQIVIRWLGSSNGYYSERVSFYQDDNVIVPPIVAPTEGPLKRHPWEVA